MPSDSVIVRELGGAARREELACVFQPQVSPSDGRITGVEALLRWRHPTLGHVPPQRFIPLAERGACIDHLTRWVVGAALSAVQVWHELRPDVTISVNLSAKSVGDMRLLEWIVKHLEVRRICPRSLTLEITETAMLGRGRRVAEFLSVLREIGVRISLDDFGTGYSSLETLASIPIDQLKIDPSFTAHLSSSARHQEVTAALCDLGRRLGIATVAEGVEDEITASLLRDAGATALQGFYFSPPVPDHDLRVLLLPGWGAMPPPLGGARPRGQVAPMVEALARAQQLPMETPINAPGDATPAPTGLVGVGR